MLGYNEMRHPSNLSLKTRGAADPHTRITVKPLLKDSPNKGHHINYLLTKDTF